MNFGLKQTADDNQEMISEEAVRTLRCNFYVDDCLKPIKIYQNFAHYFPKGDFVSPNGFLTPEGSSELCQKEQSR